MFNERNTFDKKTTKLLHTFANLKTKFAFLGENGKFLNWIL